MPPREAAGNPRTELPELLEQGREAYARRAWRGAHASLETADQATPLGAEDLELLATSASMLGLDDEHLQVLERAHHKHLEAGETLRAARCALWAGTHLLIRGEMARGAGWLARAQRLVERETSDCVERGYLLVPVMMGQEAAGDSTAAYATAVAAAGIGERFGEADLLGLARHQQGRLLIKQGRREAGFALLDETMLAVTAGELSPIVTGLIYCSVIEGCQQVYELAPCSGMDRGSHALVRGAARHGQLHRQVPGAPRGDPATARSLAGGTRRGTEGRAAIRRR